jgi:hypothetical protein
MTFIKQLLILLAGLYLIRLVGTSEFFLRINAPIWFIAVLCGVIGLITIQAFTSVGSKGNGI